MQFNCRAEREAVVTEARSWLRTPYIHGGMIKGAGCDCATFVFSVYSKAGLLSDKEVGVFASDWWCHASKETYLIRMLRHANKVAESVCMPALDGHPGNAILCKAANSRLFNHGAIITHWPYAVEAIQPRVREVDVTRDPMWAFQQVAILDPFSKLVQVG